VGSYQINWDGKDDHGVEMPSGIYLYELRSDGFIQRKKMALVK
jgi:flagellar hook assembly protein FlgD